MACMVKVLYFLVYVGMPSALYAMDLGTPRLTEPLQQEKFFNPERLSLPGSANTNAPLLEPQLAVSHVAREDEMGHGVMQTTHRVHGEAGGKLNVLGDVSLTAVAKIPVYIYGVTGNANIADGASNSELLKNTGRISWRSELGVPLGEGVDLNLFYDHSSLGKIERPGVDEREEKFGTKFIFRFK
jgi:hypothetical protein